MSTQTLDAGAIPSEDTGAEKLIMDALDADDKPEGDELEGDEPEGDEPEGDEPEGDEPEGDEEHAGKVEFTAEQQKVFDKRVGKEIGKRKEAESRLAELETANADLKAKAEAADAEHVQMAYQLGVHPDYVQERELETLQALGKAKRELSWLEEHADGYDGKDGNGNDVEWNETDIARMIRDTDRTVMRLEGRADGVRERATKQLLEDARKGRELRLNPPTEPKKALAKDAGKETPKVPTPPPAPGQAGGPARRGKASGTGAVDTKKVAEADDPDAALLAQIEGNLS